MLSSGAQRLAESKAVVKSLTDVETLGGTTVINSDKTGTLTMNAMTATTMLAGGDWFQIEGGGYQKTGAILGAGGGARPTSGDWRWAYAVHGCDRGRRRVDHRRPDRGCARRARRQDGRRRRGDARSIPRRAEVPFDSEYKFMATFHDRPEQLVGGILQEPHFMTVKGAPDVVMERCDLRSGTGEAIPIDEVRDEILAANQQLSERGLRVLAFAARDLDDAEMTAAIDDPMAAVSDLVLVSLVGIIDPLRAEAKEAVRVALAPASTSG